MRDIGAIPVRNTRRVKQHRPLPLQEQFLLQVMMGPQGAPHVAGSSGSSKSTTGTGVTTVRNTLPSLDVWDGQLRSSFYSV